MQQWFNHMVIFSGRLSPSGRGIVLLSLLLPLFIIAGHTLHRPVLGITPGTPPVNEEFHMTRGRKLRGEQQVTPVSTPLALSLMTLLTLLLGFQLAQQRAAKRCSSVPMAHSPVSERDLLQMIALINTLGPHLEAIQRHRQPAAAR